MNLPNAIGARNATAATAAFITRWQAATGSERANHQLFLTELCALLGVPQPDPARDDTRDNAYVFERRVQFAHGDGSASNGFIDCYKRGHFVLEEPRGCEPAAAPGASTTPCCAPAPRPKAMPARCLRLRGGRRS